MAFWFTIGHTAPAAWRLSSNPLCPERMFPNMCNQSIQLSNRHFLGGLHDNEANRKRQGSGFNPLSHISCPDQNIFYDDAVGLNFEHVMNGAAKDADICMFTGQVSALRGQ